MCMCVIFVCVCEHGCKYLHTMEHKERIEDNLECRFLPSTLFKVESHVHHCIKEVNRPESFQWFTYPRLPSQHRQVTIASDFPSVPQLNSCPHTSVHKFFTH